jgi:hypothetical protein
MIISGATLVLQAPAARADTGAPDDFGYSWIDSLPPPPQVTFTWEEISGAGTLIDAWSFNNSDDGWAGPFALGFSFSFYGVEYNEVFVSTNGYLSFGEGYPNIPQVGSIPSPDFPNNVAMGYGADLFPGIATPPGGVYYEILADPNRLVVEWLDVPHYPGQDPVTFEITLYETGEIGFDYLSLTGFANVVGLENADGSIGLPYAPDRLVDDLAIQFSAVPLLVNLAPAFQSVPVIPGSTGEARVTVSNNGPMDDTVDLTFDSPSSWTGAFYEADGSTPLEDTDSDGIPDTGLLPPSSSVDVILRVDVPGTATGTESVTMTGTSSVDESVSDSAIADFEVLAAVFAPPHADFGDDPDTDGLFDFLVVNVSIEVFAADSYLIDGFLHDANFTGLFLFEQTTVFLPVGNAVVPLSYDGFAIRESAIDGPYVVELSLLNATTFTLLDTDVHVTQAYSYLDFELPPIAFDPPHYDEGVDSDTDGLFDFLNVYVNVSVSEAGDFRLSGILTDTNFSFMVFASVAFPLEPGAHTLTLPFAGSEINASGVDGPYFVGLELFDNATSTLLDSDSHMTNAYSHLDFEEPPPPRTIVSPVTSSPPTIDGTISVGEWGDAYAEDLYAIPGNTLPAFLLVMHDADFLYMAYDAVGDMTSDAMDAGSLAFDTDHDETATDGREDQFVQGGWVLNDQAHVVYDEASDTWIIEDSPYDPGLPNHAGLASDWGFGSSPSENASHRMYEFRIPLALLGANSGDTLGFFGGSNPAPGVVDWTTFRYSVWPTFTGGPIPLDEYGDLVLGAADSVPPSISITSPEPDAVVGSSSVTVEWTASDDGSGIDRFEVRVDGGAATVLPGTATSHIVTGLANGVHAIVVTAIDGAGNTRSDGVTIHVDRTPPTVAITAPTPGAFLGSSALPVTWTAADGETSIVTVRIRLDTGSVQTLPGSARSHTFLAVGDGAHTVTVTAVDAAGNVATATVSVTVDTTDPVVSITSPAAGSTVVPSSFVLTWTATDATSQLDHIEVRVDGGSPESLVAGTTSLALSGLSEGAHTLTVTAVDEAGNAATASVIVTVDTTDPVVSITAPAAGSTVTSSSLTFTWTATDAISQVDRIEIRVDGGTPQTLPAGTTSLALSGLSDGEHTVTIIVFDPAGNSASESVTFRVDTSLFSPSGPIGFLGIVGILVGIFAVVGAGLVIWRMRGRKNR